MIPVDTKPGTVVTVNLEGYDFRAVVCRVTGLRVSVEFDDTSIATVRRSQCTFRPEATP